MGLLDFLKGYLPSDNSSTIPMDQFPSTSPTPLVNDQLLTPVKQPLDYGNTFLRTPNDSTKAAGAEKLRNLLYPEEQANLEQKSYPSMAPLNYSPMSDNQQTDIQKLIDATSNKLAVTPTPVTSKSPIGSKPEAQTKTEIPQETKKVEEDQAEPGPSADQRALMDAQEARRKNLLLTNLAEAGSTIGTALASRGGSSLGADEFKSLKEQANLPVEEVKEKQQFTEAGINQKIKNLNIADMQSKLATEQEKADPKSSISQLYRDSIKKSFPGMNIPESLTAAQAEKIFPALETAATRREATAARVETTKLNNQIKQMAAQDKQEQKDNDNLTKLNKNLVNEISSNKARTVSGGVQKTLNSIERADKLFEQFPDLNIPAAQTEELSLAVANFISGASGRSRAQVEALVPHSMVGKANQIATWYTNDPKGLGQQKFIKNLYETTQREKGLAQDQILQAQFKGASSLKSDYDRLAKSSHLGDAAMDSYYRAVQGETGIPIDKIKAMEKDPNFHGQYIAQKKSDQKVQDFADQYYNGNYEQAKAVLAKRGYKPQEK